ncbi:MAG: chromate efflux transporter [Bacteroidetes bacterium]|nr:chromate efflux transporter [Bacteroidota bacterium]
MLLRHVPFLKAVALYAFTAFGGPQGHLGMMIKSFANKRHDVTEEEIQEYTAFCQMLPGPTSTQTVVLIGFKRGGVPLAILTLLLWILPATLIMGAFSFLVYYFDVKEVQTNLFAYIQPMSVGFIAFAAVRMMQKSVKHTATWAIMIGCLIVTYFIRTPWVFPVLLFVAGVISNFSDKRIPTTHHKPKPIQWLNLWIFALVFIIAGIMSELARYKGWEHGRIFNLFENFYRFGAIVFGGGQALLPMMLFQFVNYPRSIHQQPLMSSENLLTGYGLVQGVPGPVFSVCSFAGGMVMSQYGPLWQVLGCSVATVAVFLPSTLLLLFLFPVYQNLKQHVMIFRALEGINAAIVGIIWGSGIVLFQSIPFDWTNVVVVAITFSILTFTKIPSPYIVLGWLLLGWAMKV